MWLLAVTGLLLSPTSAQDHLRRTATTPCDPYVGCRYQRFSNGGPVASTTVPASTWNLYEATFYNGDTQLRVTAHSSILPTHYPKEYACDGRSKTFWAPEGDADTDISTPVWDPSKVGTNWIIFDLGANSRVTHFDLRQATSPLNWNLATLRVEYSIDLVTWSPPVHMAIGAGVTRITNLAPTTTTLEVTTTVATTTTDPDATTTTLPATTTTTPSDGKPFVVAGRHFSFVGDNGAVRGVGRNNRGQLGIGIPEDTLNLTEVNLSSDIYIVDAAAGAFHALFLSAYGEVFATGWNRFGQLAIGDNDDRVTPTQVIGLDNVVAISAGYAHSLFLTADGQVWGAGLNSMGQLGDGTMLNSNVPVSTGMSLSSSISAGYDFSVFLRANSEVWATGNGLGGQLGDGLLRVWAQPVKVLTNVAAISAGESHSLFLMAPEAESSQVVKATGANFDGQLGDGTMTSRATPREINHDEGFSAISAGGDSSCFSSGSSSQLRCAGSNRDGQIGLGEIEAAVSPAEVTGASGAALQLSVGDTHSFFLFYDDSQGRVYSTGNNVYGELGDNTNDPRNTLIEVAAVDVIPTTAPPTPEPTRAPSGEVPPWQLLAGGGAGLVVVGGSIYVFARLRPKPVLASPNEELAPAGRTYMSNRCRTCGDEEPHEHDGAELASHAVSPFSE